MDSRDAECNDNLKLLCRMARAWKEEWNVPIGGLLIDTLAYQFIANWEYRKKSYVYYDWMSRDFFDFLATQPWDKDYWLARGSGQRCAASAISEYRANSVTTWQLEAIDYYGKDMPNTARKTWRQIYGSGFPT